MASLILLITVNLGIGGLFHSWGNKFQQCTPSNWPHLKSKLIYVWLQILDSFTLMHGLSNQTCLHVYFLTSWLWTPQKKVLLLWNFLPLKRLKIKLIIQVTPKFDLVFVSLILTSIYYIPLCLFSVVHIALLKQNVSRR